MAEPNRTTIADVSGEEPGKRKFESAIELAKQKAQQIAMRLVTDSESKRPRLGSDSESNNSSFSTSTPPPSYPVSFAAQPNQYHGLQSISKKISIPNGKVGMVIGKGGETIKYVQMQSGAKIQITKDQEADPHSLTRDVELMGTHEQISRAEQLINDVIAETDSGGSTPSVAHGTNTKQSGAEQFSMPVPNDKVGLLIGKGGETIKYMQNKSGARMQIIPLHLPPGDTATGRTIYINGSSEEIEAAKALVNDVINGKRIINSSAPNSYTQPAYTAGNWNQPGPSPMQQQQQQYGYIQPGYPTHPTYYGSSYSTQQPAWDQSNQGAVSQTSQQYGYYGQHQSQSASTDPNSGYSYNQTPAGANVYDQGYSQHPPSYGQNVSSQAPPYPSSTHATTTPAQGDGAVSSQSSQHASAYPPPAYTQSGANPQMYWNSSGYTLYDQTGYAQASYEGMQPSHFSQSNQPVYGQSGYPQQNPPPGSYAQGAYSHGYGQTQEDTTSQSQPQNDGAPQAPVYGTETVDASSNPSHGSNAATQEAVLSQS